MGELGALFNPGMRHEIEERESKQNRREEEGNARDGDLRIDLASGVAVINIPGKPAGDTHGAADATTAEDSTASRTVGEKPAATPAQRNRPSSAGRRSENSKPAASRSAQPKAAPAKTAPARSAETGEKPSSGPVPSSKASRSGR